MARSKKPRSLKLKQTVEFKFVPAAFVPFESLRTLNVGTLERARHAVVEFGECEADHPRERGCRELGTCVRVYSPLYQAGYMLGGLQRNALHEELVQTGKMTEQQFHDMLLGGGPMPIELVRARLEKVPLTKDYTAKWKFAGSLPTTQ